MRTLRRKISGLGAVTLATFCLLAATGCAGGAGAKRSTQTAKRRSPPRK